MRRASLIGMAMGCVCIAVAPAARSADPDPWWGTDKALHLTATAVIGAGGYTLGAAVFEPRYQAILLGAGAALAAGAGKELADMAGLGNPSWRDFTWDVIGTVVGVGLAWGLDLAIRGTGREHPVLATRTSGIALSF
jgi:putative lipoprotein